MTRAHWLRLREWLYREGHAAHQRADVANRHAKERPDNFAACFSYTREAEAARARAAALYDVQQKMRRIVITHRTRQQGRDRAARWKS